MVSIPIQMLGQSGCKLTFSSATVYVDPYLSNSVQELDAPDLVRQATLPFVPESVTDADWILITHDHIDHCDPHTIPKIALASPQARFAGPISVVRKLKEWGVPEERIMLASEAWLPLANDLKICAVPAAHPEIERDSEGNLACVGYLVDYLGKKIYLAGDTFARQEIIDVLLANSPIHTAALPVNEHNFFRGRRGIIGNMSVREAFQFASEIRVKQVVAVHWDMFAVNAVDPEEIRLIHKKMKPDFTLLLAPKRINLGDATVSLVIRTLNEAARLGELLTAVMAQRISGIAYEVILVDSGSTDGTLEIAEQYGCRILHISREDFSFGRSLNVGCEAAKGDILVITSGHCVPVDEHWLQKLCEPLLNGTAQYSYGRQLGGPESRFSEARIFAKYFPEQSSVPQTGFFCNNANSALLRSTWQKYRFDEELTGLEDMELGQRLVRDGGQIAYLADASVFHYHNESGAQIRRRFEREAIALQKIMPQVHITFFDMVRYILSSVCKDWMCARKSGQWRHRAIEIVAYRWNQFLGVYKGNHEHRKLSHAEKEKYFFPG